MSQSVSDARIRVGSVYFDTHRYDAAVNEILDAARSSNALAVRLSNAWCVVVAEDHPEYRDVLNGPGLTLPDGAAVVRTMRRSERGRHFDRVRGPSFMRSVLQESQGTGLRHFFLGSSEEVLISLRERVAREYPLAIVSGHWAPPFGPVRASMVQEASRRIAASETDIVWIGLGTPKQDFVSSELAVLLSRPCLGVGAAFDFISGSTPEAPAWVQRLGIEWFFRLVSEPRRLWRRYLIGNVRFLRITS